MPDVSPSSSKRWRYVDLGARDEVYHACRALLVHRQDQIAIFDLAFAAFWREHHERQPGQTRATQSAESRASVVETLDVLAPEDLDETAIRRHVRR